MRSRTSFFNGAIFRNDLVRFGPVWLLYTLCLLLGMFLLLDGNMEYWFAAHLGTMASAMAAINCGYALLTAQVLFGDLWNSRMCNALHAMPLRRECWFHTHVAAGLFFSLIPTAIMAGAAEPFVMASNMENGWQIPLYFLLAANLEYLFFFGLAVLSGFLAGSRVGMAVIYGIVNFFSYLVYFLVETLIAPMYYGVLIPESFFRQLCPVARISSATLIASKSHRVLEGISQTGEDLYQLHGTFRLTEAWGYVAATALVGIGLLLIARGLYRRRKLECAGDFLATKKLEPVFMIVFSLTIGTVFQFFETVFVGQTGADLVFLFAGLAVGWFGGRMLLQRQTRVLRSGKNWLGLLALAAVLALGLYTAKLDPLGIVDRVPEPEQVRSARIYTPNRGEVVVQKPEEIADILSIHQGILTEKVTQEQADLEYRQAINQAMELPEVLVGKKSPYDLAERMPYRKSVSLYITYELKSGWHMERRYIMWADTAHAQLAKSYVSRIPGLFSPYNKVADAQTLLDKAQKPASLYFMEVALPEEFLTRETMEGLLQAVIADSEAGTMAQDRGFHRGLVVDEETRTLGCYSIDINLPEENLYLFIYNDCENCLAWLEASGVLDCYREKMAAAIG